MSKSEAPPPAVGPVAPSPQPPLGAGSPAPVGTRRPWVAVAVAGALSVAGVAACYGAAGKSLGLFVGGVVVTGLLVPPLVAAQAGWRGRLLALAGVLAPVCIVWYWAITTAGAAEDRPSWVRLAGEWVRACAALAGFAAGLGGLAAAPAGLAALFRAARRRGTEESDASGDAAGAPAGPSADAGPGAGAVVWSGVVVLVALAWLTWPIWASPTWRGGRSAGQVGRLVELHPGLVVNAQVGRSFGQWTEQSVAYHLTDLNQDVAYLPPRTVWRSLLVHGGLGAVLLVAVGVLEGRARKGRSEPA